VGTMRGSYLKGTKEKKVQGRVGQWGKTGERSVQGKGKKRWELRRKKKRATGGPVAKNARGGEGSQGVEGETAKRILGEFP